MYNNHKLFYNSDKKVHRTVENMQKLQTTGNPRHQDAEKKDMQFNQLGFEIVKKKLALPTILLIL